MEPRRWIGRGGPPRARRLLALAALALVAGLVALPWPGALPSGPGFTSPSGRPFYDTIAAALFWVAAVNAALCALLAATASLWARALALPEPPVAPPRPGARLVVGLVLAALVAVALRVPLASGSVWWDEAWSLRRVVVGAAVPDAAEPGRVVVERPGWSRVLWDYRKPTNHVLYNLTGRAAVDAWRALRGDAAWSFSERAFRLPALLASGASVALFGWWVAQWGIAGAGVAAAWLFALHPWHLRYGAEGRGYAFMLLFAVAACLAMIQALRSGSWRAWLAFAASQFLLIWSQPSALLLAVALGACAGLGAVGRARGPARRVLLARCAVANLLAAMFIAQVMAPNVAQAVHWDNVQRDSRAIHALVFRELWSRATTGMAVATVAEADPPEAFPSLASLAEARPWMAPVVIGVLPLLAALGWLRLLARRGPERLTLLGLGAGAALFIAVTWAQYLFFYERFVLYLLLPVGAGLVVGLVTVLDAMPGVPVRARGAWRALGLAAALAGYQWLVAPQTAVLLTRPIAPMRDVAERLLAESGGDPRGSLRAGLGLGGGMPRVYDPWLRPVRSLEQVVQLEREAARRGVPFFMVYGYPGQNQRRHPEVLARLDDPDRYRGVARFDGVEPNFTYRILRHRADSGPSASLDGGGSP